VQKTHKCPSAVATFYFLTSTTMQATEPKGPCKVYWRQDTCIDPYWTAHWCEELFCCLHSFFFSFLCTARASRTLASWCYLLYRKVLQCLSSPMVACTRRKSYPIDVGRKRQECLHNNLNKSMMNRQLMQFHSGPKSAWAVNLHTQIKNESQLTCTKDIHKGWCIDTPLWPT